MTNKTEMVSVPRELLERWADRFSKAQMFKDSTEVRAILAAPAEDVRAVGEEPVDLMEMYIKPGIGIMINPQRPVVLPDRLDESQYRGTSLLAARRWNACLDAVEALNK